MWGPAPAAHQHAAQLEIAGDQQRAVAAVGAELEAADGAALEVVEVRLVLHLALHIRCTFLDLRLNQ